MPGDAVTGSGCGAPSAAALAALAGRFGERYSTGRAVRDQHANTLTFIASEAPDAVVWPQSTAEVSEIIALAARHRFAVIAFGAGTSLEGHVNAPSGGVALDLSRMNRITAVRPRDLDCTVEAGVSRRLLNETLRDTGLFFPVDPGSDEATLGGMAATRASGTNAVRYGTMRENVISLTAVMASGAIVSTGGRARKSAAGYDLARLLVGSEGTLGVITELSLRLYGVPEHVVAAVCPFATLEGACNASIAAIQQGLAPARIELLDAVQIAAVNHHAGLALDAAPTLFVEFHGATAATTEAVLAFEQIASDERALRFDWASDIDQRRRLWRARAEAFWAVKTRWPGKSVLVTDAAVPLSRLAECILETEEDIRRAGLVAPILGHVGDGNFHTLPVFDPAAAGEVRAVKDFADRLAERAIRLEGTCTGEHGVGQGKRHHMPLEHGTGLAVMAAIKAALDPLGILNPGKVLPATAPGVPHHGQPFV